MIRAPERGATWRQAEQMQFRRCVCTASHFDRRISDDRSGRVSHRVLSGVKHWALNPVPKRVGEGNNEVEYSEDIEFVMGYM